MMMGDVSSHPLGAIVISNVSEVFSSVHLCEIQCSLARCMGSLPCFEGHCFGPFCWGLGETVCSVISQCQPRPQAHASFRTTTNPKPGFLRSLSRISTLAGPNFGPGFFARIFFPNFFVGFPAAAAILRPEKKIREKIREPVRPLVRDGVRASQDWSPKLLRFLALQSGGPLRRLVFVHAEAAHTLQSDFLLGGRGGVS